MEGRMVDIALTQDMIIRTSIDKLQETGAQQIGILEDALKDYRYEVTTLKIIIRQFGSNQTTSDARGKIGIERGSGPAGKGPDPRCPNCKQSVLTFHKILTSRRVL